MQLLDELPMLYLILCAVWTLQQRNEVNVSKQGYILGGIYVSVSLICTLLLVFTGKEHTLHFIGRIVMVISFSLSMVYVFYAASIASEEHAQRMKEKGRYCNKMM